eukprot:TRINITY_DN2729_c0_g1_i3.p1 TRINITY_DN2729_c0_g1~~TRINITY_DN2729_c0_g1_i3.p1  ORF type:complete len:539 (+),score=118.96 TRINITY_DN2729_c0_g1_i3:75-1691(+)
MSYIRTVKFQPERLEVLSSISWTKAVFNVLKQHKHFFSDHACLRILRYRIGQHVFQQLPKVIREELFQHGCLALRREIWSAIRDFHTPDLFVPFMYVFYNTDIKQLEVPTLIRVQDRHTVLDMLYNLGTPSGHEAQSLKVKMFETHNISIGESYVLKRVLRGFRELRSLTLWKACDDAMLQILGVTCKHLENIDIWKSTNATDSGIRMFLGLDAERPFKVCSTMKKIAIKDTSITDTGAFNLMIHCEKLDSLEFSQDSFLQQLLWRISENYIRTKTVFNLKTLFLQVNKPCLMINVVKSLPRLEDLTLWTSLENTSDLNRDDLESIQTLKLGGLNHSLFLQNMISLIGSQLTCLKIETVHFDVDISLIGWECPNIEDLNIINARVKVTKHIDDHSEIFSRLKLLYFFLVQYIIDPVHNYRAPSSPSSPTGVPNPSTGHTALHTILQKAPNLESVQVSGSPALTDSCMASILSINPLSKLKRLVISHPLSIDHRTVPLTSQSVTKIQNSCPELLCLGDLKHWAVTPAQRRKLSRNIYTN